MGKFLKNLVCLVGLLLTVAPAWAQLDNRAFTSPTPGVARATLGGKSSGATNQQLDSLATAPQASVMGLPEVYPARHDTVRAGDLRLSLNAFTFFKDNEYFNDIVEGYTLFDTQLNPQLVYYPTKSLRLEGGVFLWKDYGNPQLKQVRPTFRATWTVGNSHFIFGNILPNLSHQYIEPLYDFESIMLRPLEEGLQYRLTSKRVFLDAWVNWLKQEYPGVAYQEQIAGGLSSSFRLTSDQSRFQVSIPFQFTARHHGGQIDTLHLPVQTLFNYATGVVARLPLGGPVLQGVRVNAYATSFSDHSGLFLLPYSSGNGLYLNGTLETRYADLLVSYWQGHQFYAPFGGPYYQSVASRYGTPGYTDAERRVVMVRLLRDFRISDAAAVTVRVEPVYDLGNKILDYSFGVYLNFRQEWLLGNLGRRARAGQ